MIKTTFSQVSSELECHGYMCTRCGHNLGTYQRNGEKEYDDTEGWEYCPYCGSRL